MTSRSTLAAWLGSLEGPGLARLLEMRAVEYVATSGHRTLRTLSGLDLYPSYVAGAFGGVVWSWLT
ncbi:hypothetical protein [Streptomyces sp. NPDC023588]|uniref:hypothetical protein n=1 Tax=Streptomyces sp. NPDC023588 TaxID=3154907 RepID=UPI0033F0D244